MSAENSPIIDFVDRDGYLIYGALSREWNRMWKRRQFPLMSNVGRFVSSRGLVEYAEEIYAPGDYMARAAVAGGNRDAIAAVCELYEPSRGKIVDGCDWRPADVFWAIDRGLLDLCGGMRVAVAHGDLEMIESLIAEGASMPYDVCGTAAQRNNMTLLKWAHARGYKLTPDVCSSAVANGNYDMLRWARLEGGASLYGVHEAAAKANNFQLLQWAQQNSPAALERVPYWAARHNNIAMLRWAHARHVRRDSTVLEAAVLNGNLEVLECAYRYGHPPRFSRGAVLRGADSRLVTWMITNIAAIRESICQMAAASDRLDLLQLAHARGCPIDSTMYFEAACLGHVHILQWMLAQKRPFGLAWYCPPDRDLPGPTAAAALWLFENGVIAARVCCIWIAKAGGLEELKQLPMDVVAANASYITEHALHQLHILQWMHSCRISGGRITSSAYCDHAATTVWAHRHGLLSWVQAHGYVYDSVYALRWSVEHGCPAGNLIANNASGRSFKKWLRDRSKSVRAPAVLAIGD